MLTKNDLTQIEDKIHQEIKPINDRLDGIDSKIDKIDKQFNKHDKQFNKHDKQFNKIQKDLKIIINYFDHNSADHETRLTRIEKHLGFVSS